jgi:hypothetical protein
MAELRIKTWRELAALADISYETLRSARTGENLPSEGTKGGLERALQWMHGSIDAILDGRESTPVGTEASESRKPDRFTEALEALRRAEESLEDFRRITADPEVAQAVRRAMERSGPDSGGPDPATNDEDAQRDSA